MAKGRVLSRSEARDRSVNELPPWGIVGWHRLFAQCDDDGRHIADADVLKPLLFPRNHDVKEADVTEMVAEWASKGLVVAYADGDSTIIQILKWNKHQTIRKDRYTPSDLTPPPGYSLVNDEWKPCGNQVATTPQPLAAPDLDLNLNENLDLDVNVAAVATLSTPTPRGDIGVVGREYERLTGHLCPSVEFVALCADHPTDRINEAISRGVGAGKTSASYIAGICRGLAAEGWKAPPVLTAVPNPYFGMCGEVQA